LCPRPRAPSDAGGPLVQPSSKKKGHKPIKVFRVFRNVLRSFPIITPAACKLPPSPAAAAAAPASPAQFSATGRAPSASPSRRTRGRCLCSSWSSAPCRQTRCRRRLSDGMVRIALECEKPTEKEKDQAARGSRSGQCSATVRRTGMVSGREATEEDLHVMEVLKAVSMGAGVLPPRGAAVDGGGDMEMAYVRGVFERVVGSKDSETLYMLSPDGDNGPDLSIFFVRV
ncbi:protein mizu-kussei 1, partial [Phtheirospermum japonicum]